MTVAERIARIAELEVQESQFIKLNANGRYDVTLYRLRVELDTLRRKGKRRPAPGWPKS